MPVQNPRRKHSCESIFTPKEYIRYLNKKGRPAVALPENAILLCQNGMLPSLLKEKLGSACQQASIGAPFSVMSVIADILPGQGWKPMFHLKQLHEKFKASFSAALAALTGEK